MRYLLDTNVVSELRKPRPHGAVLAWLDATADDDLHLSAVTLGELQAGVEITRERDQEKASEIEIWIDQVAQTWNILPVDARVFRVCAKLMHRRPDHLFEDALIAALKVKMQRPEALIAYVRQQNKRGDTRHPMRRLSSENP